MGKIIKLAFMAVFTVMACCGCEWKDPIDEDIEGFWRLERFETHADGQIHECERIYYGITRMVVEVAERQGPGDYGAFIGRFEYKDGRKRVVMRDFKQRANTSDNGVSATPWMPLQRSLRWLWPTATTSCCAPTMRHCSLRGSDA